jgi:hypothetical protein
MSARGIVTALFAACLLVGACTSEDEPVGAVLEAVDASDPDPDPEPEVEPEPEPDPEPEDPYAIPEEIDAEYLDRVFEALNDVDLDVQAEILRHNAVTSMADGFLRDIYTAYALADEREGFEKVLADGSTDGYAGGPLVTTTERIVDINGDCLAVLSVQDRSQLLSDPPSQSRTYSLLLMREAGESREVNPTPWKLAARVRADTVDRDQEGELCAELHAVLSD